MRMAHTVPMDPSQKSSDFCSLGILLRRACRKFFRRLPAFQHDQEVGVVVLKVLAPHETEHLFIGEIANDDCDAGIITKLLPSSLDAMMAESNLYTIATPSHNPTSWMDAARGSAAGQ